MKRNYLLLLSALFIVGLLYLFDMEITNPSLATDSGFDTSYDSGSSGGGSSGGGSSWSSGSSGGFSSGSSHSGGGSMEPLEAILFIGVVVLVPYLVILFLVDKKQKKKMILYPIILILTYIILLSFVLLLSKVNIAFTIIGLLIYFYLPFITTNKLVRMIVDKEPLIKRNKSSNKISRNNKIGSFTNGEALALYNREKHNNVPKTEKNEKLLDRGYGIYREVQRAWMNFDYDALRTLVTDELYNSYYNQLQTLELKGQKNVMNNFFLIDEELLRIDEENGLWTILMRLEVEFNDYIVDSDNKIVRGSNKDKVIMNYLLTFVENEKSEDKCPHCGAKLEEGITVCNYCKAVIQSTSSQMKLAKKEAISQRPGRSYNK